MRWRTKKPDLKWWFAVWPTSISDGTTTHWLWLEWYQYRFCGYFYEYFLSEKAQSGDPLIEQIDALLDMAKRDVLFPRVPNVPIQLLEKCRERLV